MHEDVVDEDFRVDESEPYAVNQSFGEGGRTLTCWRKVGVTTIRMDGNGLAQTKKASSRADLHQAGKSHSRLPR
jgi:hypothetical protein